MRTGILLCPVYGHEGMRIISFKALGVLLQYHKDILKKGGI